MRRGGNVDFSNNDNDNDSDDFATVAGSTCFMRELCLRPSLYLALGKYFHRRELFRSAEI